MSLLVKTVDSVVVEIHTCLTHDVWFTHGVALYGMTELKGTHYTIVEPRVVVTNTNFLKHISKEEFYELANRVEYFTIPDSRLGVHFRYHRGSIFESIKTAIVVEDLKSLEQIIIKDLEGYINPKGKLEINKYGIDKDDRINWDTYIVLWNKAVVGFLSGELK